MNLGYLDLQMFPSDPTVLIGILSIDRLVVLSFEQFSEKVYPCSSRLSSVFAVLKLSQILNLFR